MSITGGGNNETGWGNPEYDRLVGSRCQTQDQAARYEAYQKAEAILVDEMPIMPIYVYTRPRLIVPDVKNWVPNLLDIHDLQVGLAGTLRNEPERAMFRFIARRFLETIPVLFIIATATFFMMRLAPGGPFDTEKNIPHGNQGPHGRALRLGQAALPAISPPDEAPRCRATSAPPSNIPAALSMKSSPTPFPPRWNLGPRRCWSPWFSVWPRD